MSPRQSKEQLASTWIMGKPFEVGINQEFMKEVRSLVWATYRSGFEPMVGTGHATDAGWGCMIRTGQMIVAEAMTKAGRDHQQIIESILDRNEAPLSVHRIAEVGKVMGKEIGQWHTPSVTAQSLHRLLNEAQLGLGSSISQDLQLDKDEIQEKLAAGPCLIWLPMRLGVSEFNTIYMDLVKKLLMSPLSTGIGGGRPKSSYYFFGFSEDDLLYLDPHITRPAISELTEDSLATYHGDSAKRMPIHAIDPCFVASFLLRDTSDLQTFSEFLAELKDPDGANLITIGHKRSEPVFLDCEDDSDFVDVS